MYTLRDYQEYAVLSILNNKNSDKKDLIVIPQGGGKSLIIADAVDKINKKTLIISPSKEVTDQNYKKMCTYRPQEEVGVFSASFNRKEVRKFTFATIQTVVKHIDKFSEFEYVFIDEAHRTPEKNIASQFDTLISEMNAKFFGFTATPFRTLRENGPYSDKYIITQEKTQVLTNVGQQWDNIIFCVEYKDLLDKGYLNPLYFQRVTPKNENKALQLCHTEPSLVFTKNVRQLKALSEKYEAPSVYSSTSKKKREQYVQEYNERKFNLFLNYKALSTGFDAPHIYYIFLMRSFSSPAEYYQTIGRGTRLSEGKTHCYILDMGNNYKQWGNLTDIGIEWNEQEKRYRLSLFDEYIDEKISEKYTLKPSGRKRGLTTYI